MPLFAMLKVGLDSANLYPSPIPGDIMEVMHVVPVPSIFAPVITNIAERSGQKCHYYALGRNPWANARDAWRLLAMCRKSPDTLFVFHWVPHYRIALLTLLLCNIRYCLLYWGDDYYTTFLDEIRFEQHCIAKSPLLSAAVLQAAR
ncbi:MAG: hypothetical protein IPM40_00255 [Gammaproteobacteria bacterium]|nr:hypothetical protein [Gammaproteobacteria bacterium]